jgi:cell wall-associated NlpC family hydrolase
MAIPQIPDWRERILMGVGVKPTPENLRFMDAWARAEGGTAANNPFNTTQPMAGATPYNSVGVRNYGSPEIGIDATVNTLTNGRYGNIIGALRRGDSAYAVAQALAASPWGTGGLVQKILGGPPAAAGTPAAAVSSQAPAAAAPSPTALAPTAAAGGATQEGQSPARTLGMNLGQILESSQPSPTAVRMLSNLGELSGRAARAAAAPTAADYGLGMPDEPVVRTIGTMQSGSTEKKYKTIDLGQDFDGEVHPNAQPIVNMAMQYLGTPYLWGGADPRKGFDCSGFVQYLYAQAGIALPRTTYQQVKVGQAIRDPQDLQAGDIVLFSSHGDVHHEGLYIGGGQFIHAPHTGDVVKISSLDDPYYKSQFFVGRRVITNPQPPPAPRT